MRGGRVTEIHGECDARFEAVGPAFAANFEAGQKVGASVAVTLHGEPVVDLWAGDADEEAAPGSATRSSACGRPPSAKRWTPRCPWPT